MTLNLEKTNYIIFRSHRKNCPVNHLKLCIEGVPISQVVSTKFLGVYIDQHLTWKEHVKNISSKIAKNIGILSRTSKLIPMQLRTTLYYTLIYPYLTYCNLVWASTYKTNLAKLVILQKRAVRYIANIPYRAHTEQKFIELQLLKIDDIRRMQIGEFIYRFNRGLLPPVYKDFFCLTTDRHPYQTRSSGSYHEPYAHTNTRLFSIRCTGAQIWNEIPLSIRQQTNLRSFKHKLRLSILEGHYTLAEY